MLRESYKKISFPLEKKDPNSVVEAYLEEFGQESLSNLEGIRTLFAHALRDYLEGRIGKWEFGSMCFALGTNMQVVELIPKSDPLNRYLFECVDISWLSEGEDFDEYKQELNEYLKTL